MSSGEPAAITAQQVSAASRRIAGAIRRCVVADPVQSPEGALRYALEYLQHTGSFKARGALNFVRAHRAAGTLPGKGVTIASGGNAGLACAWAARAEGVPATVFVPRTAPAVKLARLHALGAEVRQVGTEYAHALEACADYADRSGTLASHAYADPLVAAGAGTVVAEILDSAPETSTLVVAVGGGGLLAGVSAAARARGVRVLAVEPEHCCALAAAVAAGRPVDVSVSSVAADALGARRVSDAALAAVHAGGVVPLLVTDEAIVEARRRLWAESRLVVEHAAAAAAAAVGTAYAPAEDERVVVLLCGANTDPGDLA